MTELQSACNSAYTDPGRVIEIVPGVYPFKGYIDWLGPPKFLEKAVKGLTIRGLGEKPSDVILKGGSGPDGINTPDYKYTGYGFILSRCEDVLFENFQIEGVGSHLFHLKGEHDCKRISFKKIIGYEAGEQFIKSTADKYAGLGISDGVIEDCHFEYKLRTYVKKNIVRAGGPIVQRYSELDCCRIETSPGSLNRSAWDEDFWAGGEISFWELVDGKKHIIRTCGIIGNWHTDPHDKTSIFKVDDTVPPEADGAALLVDRPDEVLTNQWGPWGGYTGAIDFHMARNYRINRCTFQRIGTSLASEYAHSVPAIYCWGGSENTTVEDCHFLDCETGVALGLGNNTEKVPFQHKNGKIKNIWFYRYGNVKGDRAVGLDTSPDNLTTNVKAVLNGSYSNAVEYRFPETIDSVIINLATDANKPIALRPPDTTPAPTTCNVDQKLDLAGCNEVLTAVVNAIARNKGVA